METNQHIKSELRKEVLDRLLSTDPGYLAKASTTISRSLTTFLKESAPLHRKTVLAWLPYFKGELSIEGVIDELLPSSSVYLPYSKKNGEMDFYALQPNWRETLSKDELGVPTAAKSEQFKLRLMPAQPATVIVPGIAFDLSGDRLGRGAGHYDRFISTNDNSSLLVIGVCLKQQLISKVPRDLHDQGVHVLCHEEGIELVDSSWSSYSELKSKTD